MNRRIAPEIRLRPRSWPSVLGAMALACVAVVGLRAVTSRAEAARSGGPRRTTVLSSKTYGKPATGDLKKRLTPLQFDVTQNAATESAFGNEYWDNHQAGLYVDVATGEPLFSSTDKFDSGTGWPSFTQPVEPNRVTEHTDSSFGMTRVEVRSSGGKSHLGHLFDDGPAPLHARYCINSAALRFIPVAKLGAEGYGAYQALFEAPKPAVASAPAVATAAKTETALLAGGCFWGMEELLRKIPGVIETEAVYTGGKTANPTYESLHDGSTGHAEAVRVVFDPRTLSYADLLEKWFFRMHDPTTKNRQGNDVGSQYRSAIFVTSPEQRKIAEEVKARVDKSGKWKNPVVTEITEAGPAYRAEEYHQKYLQKNPDGYTCHYLR